MFDKDQRIVLTLDAGGTNLVFTAIQGNAEIISPITLPTHADDKATCLSTLVEGFNLVKDQLERAPVAISFAFPGPADYENGIIGDLPNFPSFRGGVALGPFLEEKFKLPVFINNDGNLFAYGEALAGLLPQINTSLKKLGNAKRYKNLMAVTLGTGFGGGVVIDNVLLSGDNGCGGDVWCSANKFDNNLVAEEGASIRAVQRVYKELSGMATDITPKQIFEIAEGVIEGNRNAAIRSFETLGRVAGYTIAESLNIVDGLVVIGGGIAHAAKYMLPALVEEMNSKRSMVSGASFSRLQMKVYNLMKEEDYRDFISEDSELISVPLSDRKVRYNTHKKTGVSATQLGTSKAIALGAYAFALKKLDDALKTTMN